MLSVNWYKTWDDIDKKQEIRAATASEQLTLEQEYDMQASWRDDKDKLTFISGQIEDPSQASISPVGDVNLFISVNEEDDGKLSLVGEIELMIAEKGTQGRGFGKASLLVFLKYIIEHQSEILAEHFSESREVEKTDVFSYLRVKIRQENIRSVNLFESLGFRKTGSAANFFGEFELRSEMNMLELVEQVLKDRGIERYEEKKYQSENIQS